MQATVDVTTVDTRQPDRDKDLRSPNFFDVEKYPTMTFKSTKVTKKGAGELAVTGDLTIKETTKPVTFDVSYSPKAIKGRRVRTVAASAAPTKINRKDVRPQLLEDGRGWPGGQRRGHPHHRLETIKAP